MRTTRRRPRLRRLRLFIAATAPRVTGWRGRPTAVHEPQPPTLVEPQDPPSRAERQVAAALVDYVEHGRGDLLVADLGLAVLLHLLDERP